jgi:hypothetical protein
VVVGAAIAAVLSGKRRAEAPTREPDSPDVEPAAPGDLKGTIDKIRAHAQEAIEAAHEAQTEKEAELRREFEQAKREAGRS